MELASRASFAVLVLCSFLQQGVTLSCYECNSHNNDSCRDRPPDSVKKECHNDRPICRVIIMEVKAEFEGMAHRSRIVRTCGEMDQKDETRPCYHISEYGVNQHICSCTEDYCNSSSMPVGAMLMLLTVALMMF